MLPLEQDIERVYRSISERIEVELDTLLCSKAYAIYRHIVRVLLRSKYNATYSGVARAERSISRKHIDHSTIMHSEGQYQSWVCRDYRDVITWIWPLVFNSKKLQDNQLLKVANRIRELANE